jgi:hypothetical protein
MRYRLVDVESDSRSVTYSFSNDGSFQLRVKTRARDALFTPFSLYSITVVMGTHASPDVCAQLGVVTRSTKNSTHIQSGVTHWAFPHAVCTLKPGTDVWVTVQEVSE